ncbi:MAG: translation initiation factor IF-2 N-terminal domain-containing protein, partial [Planctomycetota bacterium]
MQKEKIRVYVLARELNVDTKVLLDMCKQAGYDVKNQLSNLEPEQRDAIEAVLKAGSQKPAHVAAPVKPVISAPLPDQRNVRNLDTRPRSPSAVPEPPPVAPSPAAVTPQPATPEPVAPAPTPVEAPIAAQVAPPAPVAPPVPPKPAPLRS